MVYWKHTGLYSQSQASFGKWFCICWAVTSSLVGSLKCSRFIVLFKLRGSRQTRSFPFGFVTGTNELTHSVGSWIFSITHKASILSNSSLSLECWANGIFRQLGLHASYLSSIFAEWGRHPSLLIEIWIFLTQFCSVIFATFDCIVWFLGLFLCKYFLHKFKLATLTDIFSE